MMLSPLSQAEAETVLARFADALAADADPLGPAAAALVQRVAACGSATQSDQAAAHHRAAVALCVRAGLPIADQAPAAGFSWDGKAVSIQTEPSVLIHEVAHYLLCPPERRALPDFGLGAGPESGRSARADSARVVDFAAREREEAMASLLGIMWETALGQPALAAFLEQNWLEGWHRAGGRAHIIGTLRGLIARGLADTAGKPVLGGGRDGSAKASVRDSAFI